MLMQIRWCCRFLLCLSLVVTGCNNEPNGNKPDAQPKSAVQSVVLHQEWFPFAGYAGEVAAEKRFAQNEGLKLSIEPGSETVDPIKLVISGAADFGVVGGDLLISAVAKDAPLVAIGVINATSPTCFLVRKDSGITGPGDFVGKRVGTLPGTNTERVYAMLMKQAMVDRSKVTEIAVPFDLQTFILRQYDVRPAFIYDEPISLDLQKIEYSIIKPADYGVKCLGTVYFTRREIVQKDPKRVQSLINALVKGWQYAINDPEAATKELVEKYPDLSADRELRALKAGASYFEGEHQKPLTCSRETWQKTIDGLESIEAIEKGKVRVDQVWTDQFVIRAYAEPKN